MRSQTILIFLVLGVLATFAQQEVTKDAKNEQEEDDPDTSPAINLSPDEEERVETVSADINFNSWSELYDYLKEIEEATKEDELGEERTIKLELMADGDDAGEAAREPVVVHGTIGDVIREVPAPNLAEDGEERPRATRPRIVATEADWTFIQDTLKKLDNKETVLSKRARQDAVEMDEGELSEEEAKGKELYEKAKQIPSLTRANRREAHKLFVEAAKLGYVPAKEKVAWFQLLSAGTQEDLEAARKAFDELVPLGRPDSQMVIILFNLIKIKSFLRNF